MASLVAAATLAACEAELHALGLRELAPGAERHDERRAVVLRAVVQRLVGDEVGRLLRRLARADDVTELLLRQHVVHAVGGEHEEGVRAVTQLRSENQTHVLSLIQFKYMYI